MKLEDIERLSGIGMALSIVFFAILLRNFGASWWMVLPIIIIIASSYLMWRVKVAQKIIARFRSDDPI